MLAHELCDFEAVHAGHVDVEENDGELLRIEQLAERITPRRNANHLIRKLVEHRADRHPLFGPIVDDEDSCFQSRFHTYSIRHLG